MTSLRRSHARPIESVELRITFKTDRATAVKIMESVPGASLRNGGCEIRVEGKEPGLVAERAREVLEKVRGVVQPPKGFK